MDKKALAQLLHVADKQRALDDIEAEMSKPDFWQDSVRSTDRLKEHARLKKFLDTFAAAESEAQLQALALSALLYQPHDQQTAILSLYAGAGGTDAQDWAEMLLRMYSRYASNKGYSVEVLELSAGDEAGIRSATIRIDGMSAYGYLKGEAGVHRLVRLSPFNSANLRQTSFALVDVIPEIGTPEVEIKNEDLRIDVYRAGGHGGQGVNTTDSAVRITHLPTGLVVAVQNERSQHQNKEMALKILASRLQIKKETEERAQKAAVRVAQGSKANAEFGSQIRNYVLHPYKLVKDVRTGYESKHPEEVLAGDLDGFIDAYLKQLQG